MDVAPVARAAQIADAARISHLEQRDRQTRVMHDEVIQRLFAVDLSIDSVAATLEPDTPEARRLGRAMQELDAIITQIRESRVRRDAAPGERGCRLHAAVVACTSELTPILGFAPVVVFSGLVDALVGDSHLVADVAGVLREALTNVAHHAHAHAVSVELSVIDGGLRVDVVDDGVGVPYGCEPGAGLRRLIRQAQRNGGCCVLNAEPGGGARLRWEIALG